LARDVRCLISALKIVIVIVLISVFGFMTTREVANYLHTRRIALVLVALIAALVCIPVVDAQPRFVNEELIWISDAYYGDLDGDGYEDDIKILLQFSLTNAEPARIEMTIWIQLPSGYVHGVGISIWNAQQYGVLNVDCLNMATESGIYTVTMAASVFGTGIGKAYITDYLQFDPPTGSGPGLPSVDAYFLA